MNQKLSENVNAKAPIDELRRIFVSFVKLFFLDIFLRNNVVDQKRKSITNALDTTDKKFTAIAMDSLLEAKADAYQGSRGKGKSMFRDPWPLGGITSNNAS